MNMDFADAMRASMNLIREQKLVEATRTIQGALACEDVTSSDSSSEARDPLLGSKNKVIDLTADIIEPETMAPAGSKMNADARFDQSQPSRIAAWNAGPLGKALVGLHRTGLSLDGLTLRRPRKALKIPEGAQFLSRSFTCPAGSRNYKLYVPRSPRTDRRALLVMLHGGKQDADDFAAGTRMNTLAEEHGFLVTYPNQSKAANASSCWNWFTPENQMRGRGEPAIIAGITSEIVTEYAVDPALVFVAGLSAGGAMAAIMGATYCDLYAALGIHSGLPYRSASDLPSAFAAMRGDAQGRQLLDENRRVRTIVFHGDADRIVHPSNAAHIVADGGASESIELTGRSAIRAHTRTIVRDESGAVILERWLVHGSGHAWSGGSPDGSYTDPQGPDASQEMVKFFLKRSAPAARRERAPSLKTCRALSPEGR